MLCLMCQERNLGRTYSEKLDAEKMYGSMCSVVLLIPEAPHRVHVEGLWPSTIYSDAGIRARGGGGRGDVSEPLVSKSTATKL